MANEVIAATSLASSTMYTTLFVKNTTFEKLCPIKDYPDLGGAPEQVETTTLDNSQATYVDGVQQLDRLEFTANYTKDDYDNVKEYSSEPHTFKLAFGSTKEGEELGAFYWTGTLSVWVVGGGVNGVREMRISISASSEITDTEPAESTSY